MERPAAPVPAIIIFKSCHSFLTILNELIIPAVTTIAVACWSVCNTGISNSLISLSSISKQRGDEISSKLIPPKVGAIYLTVFINSSGSLVSRHIGKASTSPNSLYIKALPSITGKAASGPISPSPKTAVPSVTIATVWLFKVYLYMVELSARILLLTSKTPGVYIMERSSLVLIGTFDWISILPFLLKWRRKLSAL